MNWIRERVGLQDPIYGPSAIQSVAEQADQVSYTELTKSDLRWFVPKSTCVETQTFYVTTKAGHVALAQVIYSNVAGIKTTCQFSCKVFYSDNRAPLWTTDSLDHYGFDADKYSFHADNCSLSLSEDGDHYTIKSSVSKQAIVDLKFSKAAPGLVIGKDGTSIYGTDPQKPWGSMRHAFWPRCRVEGNIMTQTGNVDMSGLGLFIHALQGMRPNLAAATWNFANFQSSAYSAIMMEFTTPPSYGSTVVNVGCLAADGKVIFAGARHKATHISSERDPSTGWLEPTEAKFEWSGKTVEGETAQADLSGFLGSRADLIDIMSQVPKFVKQIIAQAAGARPFVYQFIAELPLLVKIGEEETKEQGKLFMEATFITGEQ